MVAELEQAILDVEFALPEFLAPSSTSRFGTVFLATLPVWLLPPVAVALSTGRPRP